MFQINSVLEILETSGKRQKVDEILREYLRKIKAYFERNFSDFLEKLPSNFRNFRKILERKSCMII